MSQLHYPLPLAGNWSNEPTKSIATTLSQWLFEQGSLTQKLKANCQTFRVQLLAKTYQPLTQMPWATVPAFADLAADVEVQVREVLLYCDEQPWVFAQTMMPMITKPPAIEKLISLGEKPLGELIFNEPGVCRSVIEVAEFAPSSPFMLLLEGINEGVKKSVDQHINQSHKPALWARRSMFTLDGYSLLVAEVFLPGTGVYL